MKVTKSTIVIDSGSRRNETFTCSDPTGIQVKRLWVTSRSEVPSRAKKLIAATTKDAATAVVPMIPAVRSPIRRPKATRIRNPTSGNSGIR